MSEKQTILQWVECNGVEYRLQIHSRPGSAHWNILKDFREHQDDDWKRLSGIETRQKPEVVPDE